MKLGAAFALCVAFPYLASAHTLDANSRSFKTSQQFLEARDALEEMSGVKLPRMNNLRGEEERDYLDANNLLQVDEGVEVSEEMTEFMKEMQFMREFRNHLEEREAKWGVVGSTMTQLWDNVTQVFDFRFDAYTRAMAVLNKIATDSWNKDMPGASDIAVPTTMTVHPKNAVPLAEGVQVPETDESQGDVTSISDFVNSAIAGMASKPEDAADSGEWHSDENTGDKKWAAVKFQLFGYWPEFRSMVKWPESQRYSDEGLRLLVFYGIGQHRIRPVHPTDPQGHDAAFCVKLDFAGGLQTRPGYAKLGADAYFNSEGNILHIYRQGTKYTPNSGEGRRATPASCRREWHWPRNCGWRGCDAGFWTNHCTPAQPEVLGWSQVKMAFRGTLHAVITAIDHLYVLHLCVANSIVTANVEALHPQHIVRRMLTPFGWRSAAINYQASVALVNEWGLFERASGLTKDGVKALFNYAKSEQSDLNWVTIPQLKAKKGPAIANLNLPIDTDGGMFYDILFKWVDRSIREKYTGSPTGQFPSPDPCAADHQLLTWRNKVNEMTPLKDMPSMTCANLIDVMATFMYLVTGAHNHVGSVAAELEDPCFCPWTWREKDYPACGTPRNFFTEAITMALTALKQPGIMNDFTHIFHDPNGVDWLGQNYVNDGWKQAVREMGDLHNTIAQRNQNDWNRARDFLSFDPERIEISVGI